MPTSDLTFRSIVKTAVLTLGLLLVLSYVVFQARFLIVGPHLALTSNLGIIQTDRQIILEGQALNISRLWLNDRQIFTDTNGYFSEALILENGYTIATLRAEDKYGRTTTLSRSFVYAPVNS